MLRRTCIILMLSLALVALLPAAVSAHTLKVDGSIGVTLHANPNDELIAGSDSSLAVSVTDSSGGLNASNLGMCRCELIVFKDAVQQEQLTFSLVGKNAGLVDIQLDTPGSYVIRIVGEPYVENVFQSFSVDFPIYVKGGGATIPADNMLRQLAPFVAGAMFVVVVWLVAEPRKRKENV